MDRIPDPVPASKKGWAVRGFRNRVNALRQKLVVAWWPVPKLIPGSSSTRIWPGAGRCLLQVGLINNLDPTDRGLKWRFQASAQSRVRTFVRVSLREIGALLPVSIRFNAPYNSARAALDQAGFRSR